MLRKFLVNGNEWFWLNSTIKLCTEQMGWPWTGFYLFGRRFDFYQSLNRLRIWNSQNCSMFPLAGWLQGDWWGFISRNYVVWPTFLLMNVFIALKGSHFWFLFVILSNCMYVCLLIALKQIFQLIVPDKPSFDWFLIYFLGFNALSVFERIKTFRNILSQ